MYMYLVLNMQPTYVRPSTLVAVGERLIWSKYSTHSNWPLSTAANNAL